MLNAAAKSAKIDHLLGGILSVDLIKIFKPDFRVYDLVLKNFNCKKSESLAAASFEINNCEARDESSILLAALI